MYLILLHRQANYLNLVTKLDDYLDHRLRQDESTDSAAKTGRLPHLVAETVAIS